MSGGSAVEQAQQAICQWNKSTPLTEIEPALDTVLAATRDARSQHDLDGPSLLPPLINAFEQVYKEFLSDATTAIKLLSCIGNLVAIDDDCRTLAINHDTFLLSLGWTFDRLDSNQLADTAVKVFFNICSDDGLSNVEMFGHPLHLALLSYINRRNWAQDDAQLSLAIEVLCSIVATKSETSLVEEYTSSHVMLSLRLLGVHGLDTESFMSAVGILYAYLQDEQFKAAVVAGHQLESILSILNFVEERVKRFDGEDKAECIKFASFVISSLADLTSLPAFPVAYPPDHEFMQRLRDFCIPSNYLAPTVSMSAATGACIILGNVAVSDEAAMVLLLPDASFVETLSESVSKSASRSSKGADGITPALSTYLHAAAGLLRHLAISASNNEQYFGSASCMDAAVALTSTSHPDVQAAGLTLCRQILTGPLERTERFIASEHFLRLFHSTTAITPETSQAPTASSTAISISSSSTTPTQMPSSVTTAVALLEVTLLRNLARLPPTTTDRSHDQDSGRAQSLFLSAGPALLQPLALAIAQTANARLESEGWMGLCLLARLGRGSASDRKGDDGGPEDGAALVAGLFADERNLAALNRKLAVRAVGQASPSTGLLRLEQRSGASAHAEVSAETGVDAEGGAGVVGAGADNTHGVAQAATFDRGETMNKPEWMLDKERDNAVVLVHDLLKSNGVRDPIRSKLVHLMVDAGITI